jgi:hypothetical protein
VAQRRTAYLQRRAQEQEEREERERQRLAATRRPDSSDSDVPFSDILEGIKGAKRKKRDGRLARAKVAERKRAQRDRTLSLHEALQQVAKQMGAGTRQTFR